MDYKVLLSENAERLLDQCLNYLVYNLKNKNAAKHFTVNYISGWKIILTSFLKAEMLI